MEETKEKVKVLIGAPISNAKLYCWEEFKEGLHDTKADILLIDTSCDKDDMKEKIEEEGFKYEYLYKDKAMDRVVAARERIFEYAKKRPYTHILMIDADAILDKETIPTLLRNNRYVVSAVLHTLTPEGFPIPVPMITETEHMPIDWLDTGRREAFKIGFGCVLIDTSCIKWDPMSLGRPEINIRCERDPETGRLTRGEDYCFSDDCRKQCIKLMVDTNCQIPHKIRGQWNFERA